MIFLALAGNSDLPLARIEPGPSTKPVAPDVVATFDKLFAEEIRSAMATASPNDDGQLAERIFLEAKSRIDEPDFVSLALDNVIRLGSVSPKHQDLVYAAMRTQTQSGLKPPEPCLKQMMALAPRVLRQMSKETRSYWADNVWAVDALDLAWRQTSRLAFADAARILSAVKVVAAETNVSVPTSIEANLTGLAALAAARKQGTATEPVAGDTGVYQATLCLATSGDVAQARRHLSTATDAGARELADALAVVGKPVVSAAESSRITNAVMAMKLPSLVHRLLVAEVLDLAGGMQRRIVDQTFFGVSIAGMKKVVFVVDCSGSMAGRVGITRDELKRVVNALTGNQAFHIIFFNTDAFEMPGSPPFSATVANKQKAMTFIDSAGSGGGTNPTDALRRALAMQPDAVTLLTDGEFEVQIGDLVDRLNAAKKVRVNCVCFESQQGVAVLQRIARNNNGAFQFIDSLGNKTP